jgi:hypothetical protein
MGDQLLGRAERFDGPAWRSRAVDAVRERDLLVAHRRRDTTLRWVDGWRHEPRYGSHLVPERRGKTQRQGWHIAILIGARHTKSVRIRFALSAASA